MCCTFQISIIDGESVSFYHSYILSSKKTLQELMTISRIISPLTMFAKDDHEKENMK